MSCLNTLFHPNSDRWRIQINTPLNVPSLLPGKITLVFFFRMPKHFSSVCSQRSSTKYWGDNLKCIFEQSATTQRVLVVGPARPRTQHDCHHDTKVNPEAATAVIELLMMGGKTSETCWAVNKRQDDKLKNCCIGLVIYLNCTMMHGLTNLKFYI
jgi:hypothetical protein